MKSFAIIALLGNMSALKLKQSNRLLSNLRYDESEGPTKADLGESDDFVIARESDINIHS